MSPAADSHHIYITFCNVPFFHFGNVPMEHFAIFVGDDTRFLRKIPYGNVENKVLLLLYSAVSSCYILL